MNVMSDYMDGMMDSPKKNVHDTSSATTFETKMSKCPFAHLQSFMDQKKAATI